MPSLSRALRRDRTRGAAAVEAAIVLPVVILVMFGLIEFGLYFKDALAVSSSVRAAARTASAMPTGKPIGAVPPEQASWDFADFAAQQVSLGLGAVSVSGAPTLFVYNPGTSATPPTPSAAGACPVAECIKFTWSPTTHAFASRAGTWRPCTGVSSRNRLAVMVVVAHKSVTGIAFTSLPIKERAILAFEPTSSVVTC